MERKGKKLIDILLKEIASSSKRVACKSAKQHFPLPLILMMFSSFYKTEKGKNYIYKKNICVCVWVKNREWEKQTLIGILWVDLRYSSSKQQTSVAANVHSISIYSWWRQIVASGVSRKKNTNFPVMLQFQIYIFHKRRCLFANEFFMVIFSRGMNVCKQVAADSIIA